MHSAHLASPSRLAYALMWVYTAHSASKIRIRADIAKLAALPLLSVTLVVKAFMTAKWRATRDIPHVARYMGLRLHKHIKWCIMRTSCVIVEQEPTRHKHTSAYMIWSTTNSPTQHAATTAAASSQLHNHIDTQHSGRCHVRCCPCAHATATSTRSAVSDAMG